jgi:hypothetical protein
MAASALQLQYFALQMYRELLQWILAWQAAQPLGGVKLAHIWQIERERRIDFVKFALLNADRFEKAWRSVDSCVSHKSCTGPKNGEHQRASNAS